MAQIFKTKQLLLLLGFLMATTTPVWADDDKNYEFVETFKGALNGPNSTLECKSGFWVKTGSVNIDFTREYIYLASSSDAGSLTTPVLANMPQYALMTFKVQGFNGGESLSITGNNCIISPKSLGNLPKDTWYECTAFISVTGDNPTITFSAKANNQVLFDDVTIIYGGTALDVTISDAKYATLYFRRALDFSGTTISAYTAKAESDKVVLTKIEDGIVPANTGVVLYSNTSGTQQVPFTITDHTVSNNEMKGVYTDTKVSKTDGTYTNYILSNGIEGVGFYLATEEGAMLQANRAYLHTTVATSRALTFEHDDTTTGISTMPKNDEMYNNKVYNLSGQHVNHPTKGLFIIRSAEGGLQSKNGKKVIIK